MSKLTFAASIRFPGNIAWNRETHKWTGTLADGRTVASYRALAVARAVWRGHGFKIADVESYIAENCAIVGVPFFPGFYNSPLDQELDHEESQWAEYEAEKLNDSKWHKPEDSEIGVEYRQLRAVMPSFEITDSDIAQAAFDSTNYGAVHREAAEQYASGLVNAFSNELDTELLAEFESMTSPRFYNYETDRLWLHMPWTQLESMYAECPADSLESRIKARFTSRSGFASHYANTRAEWPESLREWDYNQLATLFSAWTEYKCSEAGVAFDDFEDKLCYEYFDTGNGEAMACLDAGRDYEKLFGILREQIAEARAEWEAENPAEPLPYRCPVTPDLFAEYGIGHA